MPRKYLSRWLQPTRQWINDHRWLKPFSPWITASALWRLTPHSVGGGIFAGAFAGLIPGPFQVISAILLAIIFRVNLPVAVAFTLYSNPLTIVPLYLVALNLGKAFATPTTSSIPDFPAWGDHSFWQWGEQIVSWFSHMGWPFFIGLILLATLIGTVGYLLVQLVWRWDVARRLKKRKDRHVSINIPTKS